LPPFGTWSSCLFHPTYQDFERFEIRNKLARPLVVVTTMATLPRAAVPSNEVPPSSSSTNTLPSTTTTTTITANASSVTFGSSTFLRENSQPDMNKSSTDSMNLVVTVEEHDSTATSSSLFPVMWFWILLHSVGSFIPFVFQSLLEAFQVIQYFLLGQVLEKKEYGSNVLLQNYYYSSSPAVRNVFSPLALLFTADHPTTTTATANPEMASVLTCLALLLCVALAVHPDGFTWIAVRRLREMVMFAIHSSTSYWAHLMNDDTGIVSSLLALATFCALFFFCYVLHRTLAPKQPRHRKCTSSSSSSSQECDSPPELTPVSDCCSVKPSSGPSSSSKKKKKKKSAKKRSAAAAAAEATTTKATTKQSAIAMQPLSCQDSCPKENERKSPSAKQQIGSATRNQTVEAKTAKQPVVLKDSSSTPYCQTPAISAPSSRMEEKQSRPRVESPATVETSASSVFSEEDHSVNVSLRTCQSRPKKQQQQQQQRNSRSKKPNSNKRGGQNHPDLVVSSRWDALKPNTSTATGPRAPTQQQRKSQGKNANGSQQRSHKGNNSNNSNIGTQHQHNSQRKPNIPVARKETVVSTHALLPTGPSTPVSTPARGPRPSSEKTLPEGQRVVSTNPAADERGPPSFFSDLNPQTPPFAPSRTSSSSSPLSPAIRPPPGLCLPPSETKSEELHSFFLSPETGGGGGSFLPSNASNLSVSRPTLESPGLMVPTGAAVPPGMDSGSSMGFRPLVKENPFEELENDAQIEAELQELGGRMIEDLLDS